MIAYIHTYIHMYIYMHTAAVRYVLFDAVYVIFVGCVLRVFYGVCYMHVCACVLTAELVCACTVRSPRWLGGGCL